MVKLKFPKINIKSILLHRRTKVLIGFALIIVGVIFFIHIRPINRLSDIFQYKIIEKYFGTTTEKLSTSEVYYLMIALVSYILGLFLIIWSVVIKSDTFTHKPVYYVDKLKLLGLKKADPNTTNFSK